MITLFKRRNMKTRFHWFNIYLLVATIFLVVGCATSEQSKQKKELSTIRLHLESNPASGARSGGVPVTRQRIMTNVDSEPFLTEGDIVDAQLMEDGGGFNIAVFFDQHGALLLDMTTSSNKGKRIAVLTQYPVPKHPQFSRWVAAPLITKRISNGSFTFSPDVSREEAERIVRGLKNVVAKAKRAARF
jgi:preprotein translocase subunit SecD